MKKILQIICVFLASYSWINAQTYTPLTPHSIPYVSLTPNNMTNFSGLKEGYNIKDEDNDNVTIHINGNQNVEVKASHDIHFDGEWLVEPNANGNFYAHIEDPMFDLVWFTPNNTPGFVPRYEKLELGLQFKDEINQAIENYILPPHYAAELNPFNPEDIEIKAEFERIDPTNGQPYGGSNDYAKVYGFYYKEFEQNLSDPDPNNWSWNAMEMIDQVNSKYNFRIRFAPPEYGTWRCKVTATVNGYPLMEAKEFTFFCAYSTNHGYMKIGPNKRYFTIDGETYVPAGKNIPAPEVDYNHWQDWVNNNGSSPLAYEDGHFTPGYFRNYQNSLVKYKDTGGEYFRMIFFGGSYEIEHERINNYYSRMNNAWEMDRLMETVKNKELLMELNLKYHAALIEPYGDDFRFNWTSGFETPVDPSNPAIPWECPTCLQCQWDNDTGSCYHTDLGLENPYEYLIDPTAKKMSKWRMRYIMSRWGYAPEITIVELFSETPNINAENYMVYQNGGCRNATLAYGINGNSPYTTDIVDGQPLATPLPIMLSEWHDEMGAFLKNDQYFPHLTGASYTLGGPALDRGDRSYHHESIDVACYSQYNGQFNNGHKTANASRFGEIDRYHTYGSGKGGYVYFNGVVTPPLDKPIVFSEIGATEFEFCDNNITFIKDLWLSFFTGASNSGFNWVYRYNLSTNQMIGDFKQFIEGINFAGNQPQDKWFPIRDEYKKTYGGKKGPIVEMYALISNEANRRAIGVIDNTTVNHYTMSTGAPCNEIFGSNTAPEAPEAPLDQARIIFPPSNPLKKINLYGMGNYIKYRIDYYSIPSGAWLAFEEKRSGLLNGQLVLEFPTLFNYETRSMVGFKVRKVGEPSFITAADNNPTYEEEQEIAVANVLINQATADTVNKVKQTPWKLSNKEILTAHPNPASNFCEIFYSGEITKNTQLLVTNVNGELVKTLQITTNIDRIDLSNIASGSYLLTIISNTNTYVTKLIVK